MQMYLPIAELPVNVLLVIGMALAVGFVSGMFGIGGGFLMTPLLIFMGVPTAVAVASEAPQIAASAFTGMLAYQKRQAIDYRLGLVLLGGGVAGGAGGVAFFNAMRAAGQLEAVIAVSYVVVLGAIGLLMLVESLRAVRRREPPLPPPAPAAPQPPKRSGAQAFVDRLPLKMRFQRSMIRISVLPLIALGAAIGFVGAVLGVGGGFLLVPALVYVFRVPTAVVVGTSLFQILITMLAATVMHAVTNASVDVVLAVMLMLGGSIGAQFGVRVGQKMAGPQLRLLLALLLLIVAGRFLATLTLAPDEPFSVVVSEKPR